MLLFWQHGYEATSMGMLATHLGISKSAIYHHVESKEEILEQALARALDALEEVLAGAAAAWAWTRPEVRAALAGLLGS